MNQRLNISIPESTLRLLGRVVAKGDRSRFIDRAVRSELPRTTKTRLRRALAEGYRERAEGDRALTAEWDLLSAEVWAQLDRDERPSLLRSAVKYTSYPSIQSLDLRSPRPGQRCGIARHIRESLAAAAIMR